MKKLVVLALAYIISLSAFAADKTICRDGVGSIIDIDYREDLGIGTVNGQPVTKVEYIISGPATRILSFSRESPAYTGGYLKPDGTLYISFTHARSSSSFGAFWDKQGALIVFSTTVGASKVYWKFENCSDI